MTRGETALEKGGGYAGSKGVGMLLPRVWGSRGGGEGEN